MLRLHGGSAAEDPSIDAGVSDPETLETIRAIATEVMVRNAPEPLGLYAFRPGEPGAALPLHVAKTVYKESFGASPDTLEEDFEPYRDSMLLLCVLDHRRRLPAGVLRLIAPSTVGLKTLNDIEAVWGRPYLDLFADTGIEYDQPRTFDMAGLAVAESYRTPALQGLVTTALIQASAMISARAGMEWYVSNLYAPAFRMVQWRFRRPFREFANVEMRPYSHYNHPLILPAWGRISEWFDRLAERDRILYDVMVNGIGIEAAVRPVDWDRLAAQFSELVNVADLRLHLR